MIGRNVLATLALSSLLTGCDPDVTVASAGREGTPDYTVLDESLESLRAEFNAMDDRLRMVFISGPSCGVCLRGMDDLNRSIVSRLQHDPRAHTLVVHVPTLGAEERHAVQSMPLMSGPRVSHYWDSNGDSGSRFQAALGISMYAWDVWMIYEPGARWEDVAPPPPAFWQHQLAGLPRDRRLDADEFASAVTARLAAVGPAPTGVPPADMRKADPGLLAVAQSRGQLIRQNHRSRGGYRRLKSITAIRYSGETIVDGEAYGLTVEVRRPRQYTRTVTAGERRGTLAWDGNSLDAGDASLPQGVPAAWVRVYEFDGWMTDWKDKGHQVRRLGMKKDGDRLPWIMEAGLENGQTWQIYVDSHTGDAYRHELMAEEGRELAVEFGDFRDAGGFRLPHRVRYFEGGRLLGTDRIDRIDVAVDDALNE